MKKKLFTLTILLLLLTSLALIAEEEKKAVPFISGLKAESRFGKVRLSWNNPANFDQYITIYRSTKVIKSESALKEATKLITLKEKVEEYIDSPHYGSYYYTLLITSKFTGKDNIIFIPFRNYTSKAVTIERSEKFQLTSLTASAETSSIHLEWEFETESRAEKELHIYRSTSPITDEAGLEKALKVAATSIHKRSYVDSPAPNIRYYYALFPADTEELFFTVGVNTTSEGLSISARHDLLNRFNIDTFIPLPLLTFKNDPKSGRNFIDPMLLKSPKKIKYKKKVASIIAGYKEQHTELHKAHESELTALTAHLPFHMLNDEALFEAEAFESEYSRAISLIRAENYDDALTLLEGLLEQSLSETLLKRVAYYTGAIYYNKGSFYKAYIYLVLPFSDYRREILPYIESIYFNIYYSLER